MEALLKSIEAYASQTDEQSRRVLSGKLRDLSITFESSNDTLQRVIYQPLEVMVAKLAIDMGLFKTMASSNKSQTVEELATQTNVDPRFMGEGIYRATNVTRTFAVPGYAAGISFHSMFYNPIITVAPSYFEENGYQSPVDATNSPFSKAFNTDMPLFTWAHLHPEYIDQFVPFMNILHEGRPSWTSVMNLRQEFQGRDPNLPLFVDVGGGMGSQSAIVRNITTGIPGRIINQDLKGTLDHAEPIDGVENMVHDFFTPQPVKGAKYYFLRNIVHDYPDDRAIQLLKHLISAMGDDSVILISDIVIPNTGAHRQAVQQDIAMMIAVAAMERTETQWRDLLARAGLEIRAIKIHGSFMPDAVIEAVPKVHVNRNVLQNGGLEKV